MVGTRLTGEAREIVDHDEPDGPPVLTAEGEELLEFGPICGLGGLAALLEHARDLPALAPAVVFTRSSLHWKREVSDLLGRRDSRVDHRSTHSSTISARRYNSSRIATNSSSVSIRSGGRCALHSGTDSRSVRPISLWPAPRNAVVILVFPTLASRSRLAIQLSAFVSEDAGSCGSNTTSGSLAFAIRVTRVCAGWQPSVGPAISRWPCSGSRDEGRSAAHGPLTGAHVRASASAAMSAVCNLANPHTPTTLSILRLPRARAGACINSIAPATKKMRSVQPEGADSSPPEVPGGPGARRAPPFFFLLVPSCHVRLVTSVGAPSSRPVRDSSAPGLAPSACARSLEAACRCAP